MSQTIFNFVFMKFFRANCRAAWRSAPLALVCPSQSLGNCRATLNDRGQAALATTPSEDQQWATSEKGAHQWIDDDVITSPQR